MPRLTDRDRLLIAFLATARYLTSKQVARLVFPGRADSTLSERLNALAQANDLNAYLRRLSYRTYEGKIVVVWALSKIGYHVAEGLLGGEVKIPRQDIGADFLEHSTTCSQLFVFLAQKQSRSEAAELPTRFHWFSSEGQGYPYGEYDQVHGKRRDRLLQPDAVLEIPHAHRRYFIELEMGTHPIASATEERAGATLAKAERYEKFILGFADSGGKQTFYGESFPERMLPELLFVVTSAKRKGNVNEALAEWRKDRVGQRVPMRALTLADASRELRELIGAKPRITEERSFRPPALQPAPPPAPPQPPLLTREEFQVLAQSHQDFIDLVHRQHELHRQLAKAGKAPQFPFERYPKDAGEASKILEAIYRRFAAAKQKGS